MGPAERSTGRRRRAGVVPTGWRHGWTDALPLLLALVLAGALLNLIAAPASAQEVNSCVECHTQLDSGPESVVAKFEPSVHAQAGIRCVNCHGGDETNLENAMSEEAGFTGKPSRRMIPELCGSCHADPERMRQFDIRTDQLALYRISTHGRQLYEKDDPNVATCVNCHGTHDIRRPTDPASKVYYANVPETCGSCHANAELMQTYELPADQLERYKKSYHGQILYGQVEGKNPALVPTCASCHGVHGATPPGVTEIANVCGNCHVNTATYYRESPHFVAMQTYGLPQCVTCHGNHEIPLPTLEMLKGNEVGQCGSCHGSEAQPVQTFLTTFEEVVAFVGERVTRSVEELEQLERGGMDIRDLQPQVAEASNKVIELGPVSHSLSVDAVLRLKDGFEKIAGTVDQEIERMRREVVSRRRFSFTLIGLLLAAIAVVGVQMWRFRRVPGKH